MADVIVFYPSDLESVISLQALIDVLIPIIRDIQSSNTSYGDLKSLISKLEGVDINKNSSIETLFQVYEQIKKISMQLRKVLSRFISLDVYDSIEYSLYYDGRRYSTDTLKLEWLTKNSKGSLLLNMEDAVNDMNNEISDALYIQIQDNFQHHYGMYLNAILGTYNGVIGRGSLNMGHISEAYEEHILEDHPELYRILNSGMTVEDLSPYRDIAVDFAAKASVYWANHEDIDRAWLHIQHSLGTQRGTVAGDVGKQQVKSIKSGGRYQTVRLASLKTLQDGIDAYSAILSGNPAEVAEKIARYMSEPIRATSAKLLTNIADENIRKLLAGIGFKQDESSMNKNLIVHI